MISINRLSVQEPKALKGKWRNKEHKAMLKNYTSENPKPLKFKAYNYKGVKSTLDKLFNNKCAFCERILESSLESDVEHFRPKGGVINSKGETLSPGYYWLGSIWENLYLSCKSCNSEGTYTFDDGNIMVLGKANQFPLNNEILESKNKNHKTPLYGIEEKYRLLVDPCKDNAEDFFQYESNGKIIPNEKLDDNLKKRAEISIYVFALFRPGAEKRRRRIYARVNAQINRIIELLIFKQEGIRKISGVNINVKIADEMKQLERFCYPDQECLGLTKSLIVPFYKEYFKISWEEIKRKNSEEIKKEILKKKIKGYRNYSYNPL